MCKICYYCLAIDHLPRLLTSTIYCLPIYCCEHVAINGHRYLAICSSLCSFSATHGLLYYHGYGNGNNGYTLCGSPPLLGIFVPIVLLNGFPHVAHVLNMPLVGHIPFLVMDPSTPMFPPLLQVNSTATFSFFVATPCVALTPNGMIGALIM